MPDTKDARLLAFTDFPERLSTFLADAFRTYPDPLFVKSPTFEYMFVNETFAKFIGKSVADIIGKNDFDLLPENVAAGCQAADSEASELHRCSPERLPLVSDEVLPTEDGDRTLRINRYILSDGQGGECLFGVVHDVTIDLRTEAILRETQTAAQIGSFEFRENRKAIWSEEMFHILGFDPKTATASLENCLELIVAEDRDALFAKFEAARTRRERNFISEFRIRRRNDGAIRWIRSKGRLEFRASGIFSLGTCQDVTDRKASETKQIETEKQLAVVLQMIDEVVWSLGWGTYTPLFMSPTAEKFYGHSMSELMTREQWQYIFTPEESQNLIRAIEFAAMSGIDTFSGEYRFRHPERGERIAFVRGKIVRGPTGEPDRIDGMSSDVTENRKALKELEENRQKLLALSKLNTLGELASGIGHEINTPLSGILSKIARVERSISEKELSPTDREKSSRLLLESMEMVERVSQIVDGLKQLSRNKMSEEYQIFDPITSIDQALSLSRARFSNHGFRVKFDRQTPAYRCRGNATTLFQALVNLLNNSFDALDEKQAASGRTGTEGVEILIRKQGERVGLHVVDNGIGIPESFRPRLFEAFETTKPEGKGTGLGLNISRRLLRALGGELQLVSSEPGRTEFEISLPMSET